jgi:spore maturation protein CgeB
MGRTKVSKNYLEALLTTKIVVVAQRDMWEDHYRLFEAISCGALVMTDPMLSLPDELVDGENIIVYHSLDHLRKLVHYYLDPARNDERLQIAHAGWKLAISRHRTYHWMEELFFGQRISA